MFKRYGLPSDPVWKQNDLLEKPMKPIDVKLEGPETIAIGPNGSIYTGLRNGMIVRVNNDRTVEKIVQIGDEKDERVCGIEFSSYYNLIFIIYSRMFFFRRFHSIRTCRGEKLRPTVWYETRARYELPLRG